MKRNLTLAVLFALTTLCLTGCKKEKITLSLYEIWSPKEAAIHNIQLTANCDWTLSIDDDADWYTIRRSHDTTIYTEGGSMTYAIIDSTRVVTSGSGSMSLAVVVESMEGVSSRSSSFTITSAKGKVVVKVSISQNTEEPSELTSISNLVFGVANVAHWNTDFFGEIIEDSYKYKEYDPADTTRGYIMFFFGDGTGIQRDHHSDSTVYYPFTYVFDAANHNLHVEFDAIDTIEVYDAPVLTATLEVFRFMHEYKPNFWERADMKKIGSITTREEAMMKRNAKKRKPSGGVFMF